MTLDTLQQLDRIYLIQWHQYVGTISWQRLTSAQKGAGGMIVPALPSF